MASFSLMFANESSAAKLLDLKLEKFRDLVKTRHLPEGREIAPGIVRWDVEELYKALRGEFGAGMGGVQW